MRFKANKMGYSLNQRGLHAGVIRDPSDRRKKLHDGEPHSPSSPSPPNPCAPRHAVPWGGAPLRTLELTALSRQADRVGERGRDLRHSGCVTGLGRGYGRSELTMALSSTARRRLPFLLIQVSRGKSPMSGFAIEKSILCGPDWRCSYSV